MNVTGTILIWRASGAAGSSTGAAGSSTDVADHTYKCKKFPITVVKKCKILYNFLCKEKLDNFLLIKSQKS